MRRQYSAGERFNFLTLVSFLEDRKGKKMWLCKCDCGKETAVSTSNMITGHTLSCGCANYRSKNATHKKSSTSIYSRWRNMKVRCYDESSDDYAGYGGRGIKVCDRWLESFENFYEDMGDPPSAIHTIDRRDNDGDYGKDNCRWATKKEQANNRRSSVIVNFKNERVSLTEAAARVGTTTAEIWHRRKKYKESVQQAVDFFVEKRLG